MLYKSVVGSLLRPTTYSKSIAFKRTMISAQAVVYSKYGEPKDVLFTHKYEIDDDNVPADSIVIKTLGSPVNPSDINQVQGVYPSRPELTNDLGTEEPAAVGGNEGLFEVVKVGSGVSNFKAGDWCVPTQVNFGTWRTHALCQADQMTKLGKTAGKESGLTVNQGATISVNPLTALLLLTHYVKLQPGKDWVVQNGANSAVGKYVSQIAKILNINTIGVVRDRENLQALVDELQQEYGAQKVITEEQNELRDFSATVKSWVKETGGDVKLAFNCVGGKNATAVARKLGQDGLMLTYGGMSFQPVVIPTSLHIFKNVTSSGFWVTALLKNNSELKQRSLDQIVEWYGTGKLKDAKSTETKFDGNDLAKQYVDAVAASKQGKQLIVY